MRFKKSNVNPKGNLTQDCVIRAISTALNQSWYKVFDDLCKVARNRCFSLGSTETLKEYLVDLEHKTCPAIKGKERKKVKDFNNGVYILSVANHLTCVVEGVNMDTWDCRKKCVYRYWRVSE